MKIELDSGLYIEICPSIIMKHRYNVSKINADFFIEYIAQKRRDYLKKMIERQIDVIFEEVNELFTNCSVCGNNFNKDDFPYVKRRSWQTHPWRYCSIECLKADSEGEE